MTRRTYRPLQIEYEGQTYRFLQGRPGKPRVYRIHRTPEGGEIERKVNPFDPIMPKLAVALRAAVDHHKAEAAREEARRRGWRYRLARWLGRLWARLLAPAKSLWLPNR